MLRSKLIILGVVFVTLLSACSGTPATTPAPTVPAATQAPATTQAITTPAPIIPSTGGLDWTKLGFPTVLASQQVIPGTATTITAGPYTIQIPADAFTQTVTLQVLQGTPTNFMAKAPSGVDPVLAFAISVTTADGQFISKFNNPILLTANNSAIVSGSRYYNLSSDGTYTLNATGMQVSPGKLTHPIAGDGVAWVITAPASTSSTAPGAATTVQIANNPTYGPILVNDQGMTLYTFKSDKPGVSNCTGNCATLWPPLTVAKGATPTAGAGISGKLGVIQRADGSEQVTYNGMPLYRFSGDVKAGDTAGQGLYNLWYVVSVNSSSTSSSSSGTGGRGGY